MNDDVVNDYNNNNNNMTDSIQGGTGLSCSLRAGFMVEKKNSTTMVVGVNRSCNNRLLHRSYEDDSGLLLLFFIIIVSIIFNI